MLSEYFGELLRQVLKCVGVNQNVFHVFNHGITCGLDASDFIVFIVTYTSSIAPYTNVIYWITKKPPTLKPRRQFRKGK